MAYRKVGDRVVATATAHPFGVKGEEGTITKVDKGDVVPYEVRWDSGETLWVCARDLKKVK